MHKSLWFYLNIFIHLFPIKKFLFWWLLFTVKLIYWDLNSTYLILYSTMISIWFFFFSGCTHGKWKSLGQGSNLSQSRDLRHSCRNTGSLTCCVPVGTPRNKILIRQLYKWTTFHSPSHLRIRQIPQGPPMWGQKSPGCLISPNLQSRKFPRSSNCLKDLCK